MLRGLVAAVTVVAVATFCSPFCSTNAWAETFTIQEHLGRAWSNEFVSFAAESQPGDDLVLRDALVLRDGDGRQVPFQWIRDRRDGRDGSNGSADHTADRIGFQVDLQPYATKTYRLAAEIPEKPVKSRNLKNPVKPVQPRKPGKPISSLAIDREPNRIVISNQRIGLSVWTRPPDDGAGPIAAIRLASGKWVGGSALQSKHAVSHWDVEVTATGPVFVELLVRITFADLGVWQSRFRIDAGEPVVLVDEQFDATGGVFRLQLDRDFQAESLLYRHGRGRIGMNASVEITPGLVHQLEPWLRWWEAERRGPCFGLYGQQNKDLLAISARHAGTWVDPSVPPAQRAEPLINLVKDGSGLHADFPIRRGARSWMIGCHDRSEATSVIGDRKPGFESSVAYRYLIKHGHFPLNMVKDYVLQWSHQSDHPRMLISSADVKHFRDRNAGSASLSQALAKQASSFVRNPPTLTVYSLDDSLAAYLATQDEGLGSHLAALATSLIDDWVASLLDQQGLPLGAAPHNRSTKAAAFALADLFYDSKYFSDQQRERLCAKLAFLGYSFARPEYWSVQRGFSANPNMTTSVLGYRTMIASFLADHPEAKRWGQRSLAGLRNQLHQWSDDGGGWLESPHYAVVSYDQILGALVMAQNAGLSDALLEDPKVKLVARWLAQINTPPDSRIGGFRHHPPIGHTYVNEPCGDFGLLAYLFRESDPEFSAQMQWQYQQNNAYAAAGIGGFFPAFAGYRKVLTDPALPSRPPSYSSVLFPKTGVVLRDSYPSNRETYLHMILGQHREHYDQDSGSFILYGKGRVLIDEFGYTGAAPVSDHSMIECASVGREPMLPARFHTSDHFDFIEGKKQNWMRQVALVKGASPESPAYVVIKDNITSTSPVTWRAWCTASSIDTADSSATVVGQEDVDLEVFFLSPAKLDLTTQQRSRKSGSGLYPNWTWKGMTTTQIGLIGTCAGDSRGKQTIAAVLFPRLKDTPRPAFTVIANGNGVRVDHSEGTDWVFLSDAPLQFRQGEISFAGSIGVVQHRGGKQQTELVD